jgi:hypothetical protein
MSALRRFKPYPAYKVSDVEWLRRIPAHWQVRRLKTLASVRLSNVDSRAEEARCTMNDPEPALASTPRFTAKQGQYLSFIYYFSKIHGVAPAEADLQSSKYPKSTVLLPG